MGTKSPPKHGPGRYPSIGLVTPKRKRGREAQAYGMSQRMNVAALKQAEGDLSAGKHLTGAQYEHIRWNIERREGKPLSRLEAVTVAIGVTAAQAEDILQALRAEEVRLLGGPSWAPGPPGHEAGEVLPGPSGGGTGAAPMGGPGSGLGEVGWPQGMGRLSSPQHAEHHTAAGDTLHNAALEAEVG